MGQKTQSGQLLQAGARIPTGELACLAVRVTRLNASRDDHVIAHADDVEAHLLTMLGPASPGAQGMITGHAIPYNRSFFIATTVLLYTT